MAKMRDAMIIRTDVHESKIFGKGVFAAEEVPKGKIICSFTLGSEWITEQEFIYAVERGVADVTRTGTRYAGQYFTINRREFETAAPTSFFNHSFEPNCLCHCGLVIARCHLAKGEEMTLDYRTLVDDSEIGIYDDATTGQSIRGFSAKETLLRTARELIALVESVEDWKG